MFEDILKSLNAELDGLRAKRVKCNELMEKVQDGEKKAKLAAKHDIICDAIDRVCLCISILEYTVSVEFSPDFTTVRFVLLPSKQKQEQLFYD